MRFIKVSKINRKADDDDNDKEEEDATIKRQQINCLYFRIFLWALNCLPPHSFALVVRFDGKTGEKKNATPESSFNQKNERKMKPKRLCHIIKHSKSNDSLIVLIDLWIGFAHLIILFASFSYSVRRFLYVLLNSNEWSTPAHAKNTMICIFLIMQLNSLSEQFIDYILSNLKQCRKFDCLSNFACEKEIKRNLTWCNRKQFVDWISLSMLISIASHECAPVFVCDSSSPNPFMFERWIFFLCCSSSTARFYIFRIGVELIATTQPIACQINDRHKAEI